MELGDFQCYPGVTESRLKSNQTWHRHIARWSLPPREFCPSLSYFRVFILHWRGSCMTSALRGGGGSPRKIHYFLYTRQNSDRGPKNAQLLRTSHKFRPHRRPCSHRSASVPTILTPLSHFQFLLRQQPLLSVLICVPTTILLSCVSPVLFNHSCMMVLQVAPECNLVFMF